MCTHVHQSKRGRANLLGVWLSSLLILILTLPHEAVAQKAKGRRASQVLLTAANANRDPALPTAPAESDQPPTIDVLQGLRTGRLSATAEGTGEGKMTLSLTNRTNSKLRVVLPPGLIATGATGQFGGMGGFGGGMGMGGMGGGMGMMGGGMGGMGGGMGMMGGGMGGMGGGMGRGGMMGGMGMTGTMPASMGMMMLGRLIMSLVGDRDSWDSSSLMMGMMMGMGGGMGMMGGGMGMMGGMGRGGMGGGFRSIPPTSLPEATLQAHQVRHLATAVVSLNGPDANARPGVPAKGEKLQIGTIDRLTEDLRSRDALKRLAEAKAPQTIAQMALWYVTAGADWDDIGRLSQGWGNAHEISLAKHFVARLENDNAPSSRVDPGTLYWDIKAEGDRNRELSEGFRALWEKYPVIGLSAKEGVPTRPGDPSLACRMEIGDAAVDVKLSASHPSGSEWVALGGFRIKRSELNGKPRAEDSDKEAPSLTSDQTKEQEAARLGDAVAEGLVGRLVRVHLSKGPRAKGKESFRIKILNESPLILNGLALGGSAGGDDRPPSVLAGLCLPPLKSFTVPASAEMVARLHLDDGVRVLAADLSGL